ncbi:hypothetical protein ANN_01940 [Periplaneta americana]|uniref:HTH CENPB-type domain-containing protein n=1 Tax=Periplaneta americana TaxID=6978 RepID=A0ABQ8TXD5_PERAM|nr:hypothetical protein ANN_01940 [Periplaneta americana]
MIEESEKGTSARKIAEIFKCGRTQINGIIKNKDEILKELEEKKKRKRKSVFSNVNDFVYKWFKCARAKKLPVSGHMIQEKALEIAKELNEEKKKLAGSLAKKELPIIRCTGRYGEREKNSVLKKISDENIKIYGFYIETKRKEENRKDWRKCWVYSEGLALGQKTSPPNAARQLSITFKLLYNRRFVCNCGRHLQWSGARDGKTLLSVPEATDPVAGCVGVFIVQLAGRGLLSLRSALLCSLLLFWVPRSSKDK